MNSPDYLDQPVASLAGVGKRTASQFEKLNIFTVQDLLFHLPVRYEDRTRITPISELSPGISAYISGIIEFAEIIPRGRRSLICRINDGTGWLDLRFFHYSAKQYQNLKPGLRLNCYGEARPGYAGMELVHPEYKVVLSSEETTGEKTLTPVYPLTQGLYQSVIRKALQQVLDLLVKNTLILPDLLPREILKRYGLPSFLTAITDLHEPKTSAEIDLLDGSARKRLALEELLTHHISLILAKQQAKIWRAPRLPDGAELTEVFLGNLPFDLTEAQLKVIKEISADCSRNHPMLRLVQGDVGSGKTVVAAYTAFLAINAGYQAAIMAPTELLAEQHYRNLSIWFKPFSLNIGLFTGQLRGKSRKDTLSLLADGEIDMAIGTHALFQEDIVFSQLGVIIIDEQHRFGVHQRLALREKGLKDGTLPHQLIMTATPIPRTLAMLQYCDLDLSIIDQLPPGRKPVITSIISNERRIEVIERIRSWISDNKQAYWVCTLIEESEFLQCQAAEKTAENLTLALPNVRIGLLHGRMKTNEKDAVMTAFKNHQIDLLVATTVIEVGVDVPDASLMVIENAERMGLSQLHQLRGRVGRGGSESYCLLLYQVPLGETARQRLSILRDSQDGFLIAEKDLEIRGPGEVMGIRQTGQVSFKIADLAKDTDLLDNIPEIAELLLTSFPESIPPLIKRWLGRSSHYSEV